MVSFEEVRVQFTMSLWFGLDRSRPDTFWDIFSQTTPGLCLLLITVLLRNSAGPPGRGLPKNTPPNEPNPNIPGPLPSNTLLATSNPAPEVTKRPPFVLFFRMQ